MRNLLLISMTLLLAGAPAGIQAAEAKAKVLRWVVAHDRGNTPFAELNREFGRRVEKRSGGSLKVEFIDSGASDGDLDAAAYKQVRDGGAEMSQLGATAAGVNIFDAPFVFRNYEHAEAVFESNVGKKLVSQVSKASAGKIRGFGFTYSGGYRMLVSNTPLRSAADFKGLRMRRGSSMLSEFLQNLGVKPVDAGALPTGPVAGVAAGKYDVEETEVNRLTFIAQAHPEILGKSESFNLTRHRMYVTAVIANEKFLAGLTPEERKIVSEEAESLAANERRFSVTLEKKNLPVLEKLGLNVVEFPAAELPALVKAGQAVYSKSPEMVKLVAEIRAVKDSPNKLASR